MAGLAMQAPQRKAKLMRDASPCSLASCSTTASGGSRSTNLTSNSWRSSNSRTSRSSSSLQKIHEKRREQIPTRHSVPSVMKKDLEAKTFILGELIGAIQSSTLNDEAFVPVPGTERFIDLLEAPEGYEKHQQVLEGYEEHQQALQKLNFSITLADPSRADCPVVACSAGFTDLTGYHSEDVIGKGCCLLECGMPCGLLLRRACMACRALYTKSECGKWLSTDVPRLLVDERRNNPGQPLANDEVIGVETITKKNGELFRCMFYLKDVELDEQQFIVGLQAPILDADLNPEEQDKDTTFADEAELLHQTFVRLSQNMDVAEQVLASHFWYSAGMRRQIAEEFDHGRLEL